MQLFYLIVTYEVFIQVLELKKDEGNKLLFQKNATQQKQNREGSF